MIPPFTLQNEKLLSLSENFDSKNNNSKIDEPLVPFTSDDIALAVVNVFLATNNTTYLTPITCVLSELLQTYESPTRVVPIEILNIFGSKVTDFDHMKQELISQVPEGMFILSLFNSLLYNNSAYLMTLYRKLFTALKNNGVSTTHFFVAPDSSVAKDNEIALKQKIKELEDKVNTLTGMLYTVCVLFSIFSPSKRELIKFYC